MKVSKWKAPINTKLPDFIIAGAMKSATSSIHNVLSQHDKIFIPEGEIGFFDLDDIIIHPDFSGFNNKEWHYQNFSENQKKCWEWYSNKLSGAKEGQLIGEDSTSYLESNLAFKRIAIQIKPIKIIVMLRQPTMRAYSQYWHMLRTGRVSSSFEKVIEYTPHQVLNRSLYYEQIENLYKSIDGENIYINTFEKYIQSKRTVINEILSFLEVDSKGITDEVLEERVNEAQLSQFPKLDYLYNTFFRKTGNIRYLDRLPIKISNSKVQNNFLRVTKGCYRIINPLKKAKKPKINPSTKLFLDEYFEKRLNGIDELVGKPIMKYWF